MRLTCQQESLKKALDKVNRATAIKSPLPILLNVLIQTHNGKLLIKGTDLELGITAEIGARVEDEGGITVPAKLFTDVISKLPPEKVALKVDQETTVLTIECERFKTNLKGIKSRDFPPIPTGAEGAVPLLTIHANFLREGLEQTAFAVDTGGYESRLVLTGVLVRLKPGEEEYDDPYTLSVLGEKEEEDVVTLAAANGVRLAVRTMNLPNGSVNRDELRKIKPVTTGDPEHYEIIVPGRACKDLVALLKDTEEDMEIFLADGGNCIIFRVPHLELVSQLIDGKFPDFERIIPTEYTTRALMTTSEFAKAVNFAAVFALASQNIVKLALTPGDDVSPGKLVISANAAELGDTTCEVDGIVHGDLNKVATNVKYLTEALNAIRTAQVAIEAQTAQSPVVFKPVGNSNLLQIVMPMTIRE